MKLSAKNLFVILFLTVVACEPAPSPDPAPAQDPPAADEYPRIESTTITSKYVFDNYSYPVLIYLPKTYETDENLPVIYALDGALNLDNVKNNLVPIEAIIVAVGDFAAAELWQRRWVDLMPTESECFQGNGKHLDFYDFLTKELVPYVDNNYQSNHNSRTLVGHSSAGLFAIVSMFLEDPENLIFKNYLASDPEIGCDASYFSELMDNDNFSNNNTKLKLYLALSGDGTIDAVKAFAAEIKSKNYTWLSFSFEEFLEEGHMSVINRSFKSGLEFFFN